LGQEDHGITQTVIRELQEELTLPELDKRRLASGEGLQVIGLLNDDSSPAGRRHFGVVFRYEVSDDPGWDEPVRGEKSITRLRWLSADDDTELNDFEYWSQLCLLQFHPDLATGEPSSRVRRITPFRPPHAICIVGQIGSGKSEAAELLRESLGYTVVNSGQVLARLLGRPAVTESSRSEFQAAAQAFIEAPDGPGRLAAAVADEIDSSDSERIIVDGIRQRATFVALRERAGRRVAMLYVHSPAHIAHQFYNARSGKEHSFLEFAAVREAQVESEVPTLIGIADAVLFNWQGVEEYRQVVREFLQATQSARRGTHLPSASAALPKV
jgi:dephospho-CoA kinase